MSDLPCEGFDYDQLDPGIRRVVQMLHAWDYETTDSGDGVTKLAAGWTEDDARPYPHVSIKAAGPTLVYDAILLRDRLTKCGIHVDSIGPDPAGAVSIQASYDPANGTAIIELVGLNDEKTIDARVVVTNASVMAFVGDDGGKVTWAKVG